MIAQISRRSVLTIFLSRAVGKNNSIFYLIHLWAYVNSRCEHSGAQLRTLIKDAKNH